MGYRHPLFPIAYPVHPLSKKVFVLLISIEVGHVKHQPKCLLPCCKMIYPLRQRDMLGSVTPKELVQCKLTVPPIKRTPKDFSPYEYPPSIWGDLVDRQTKENGQLTV